jgi:hypothetical protein
MSSSPSFCGICDIRHIFKSSEFWCPDCEEGLCAECIEYHSLVKLSRVHITISIAAKPNQLLIVINHFNCIDHYS